MKTYKWTVEFEVSETWVADGFDLTEDRATSMISDELPFAYGDEIKARVIKAPTASAIRKAQGYDAA